jgi:hypothetical protein
MGLVLFPDLLTDTVCKELAMLGPVLEVRNCTFDDGPITVDGSSAGYWPVITSRSSSPGQESAALRASKAPTPGAWAGRAAMPLTIKDADAFLDLLVDGICSVKRK